ncbi:MAG: dockerin type I domain-containing protein [candidate division Zixibacteria bacterium]|nr:dockerin type I domain-containing protein [candidate division Zixibacteria bacterium]
MKKKILLLLTTVLLAGFTFSPVVADWVPADGHKMHFPQLPDEAGWDVNATQPLVLADDWTCTETGPVKDIHFWGSWMHGVEGQIVQFVLSIHADIPDPDGPGPLFSMPGPTMWEQEIPINMVIVQPIDPPTPEGWYDPSTGMFLAGDHQAYFQYNVFLPENMWFYQEQGMIYWLNISAIVADPTVTQWGWKSTQNHWMDDAVWATWGGLAWDDMFEPPMFVQSLDLSFVITAGKPVVEACCLQDGSCIMAPPATCLAQGGTPQGAGTACTAVEACCLPDGSCLDLDPLCCAQQGGIPLGAGTVCTVPEACCLPSGGCTNLDPLCCAASSGAPQGAGTTCTQVMACCLPDGSCLMIDALCCDDMGGTPSPIGAPACLGDLNQNGIDDACEAELDTCSYYKPPYPDYAPFGMPDFDQKQNGWIGGPLQTWSFCGPVALADCFWWFDSKFEPNPQPQPTYSDGYPLVQSYATMLPLWDDHDPSNVIPFVNQLAPAVNCVGGGLGTYILDLATGARNWINASGLNGYYTVNLIKSPPPELIRDEVLRSQDVILLLGFYEEVTAGYCNRLGGHYVTVAGACLDNLQICISDPFFDKNEGEPPAGGAHVSSVHNDAAFISGPHGMIHHDAYTLALGPVCANLPGSPPFEIVNYPSNYPDIANFENLNQTDPPVVAVPYQGGTIHALIDYALIICPDSCALQYPGDVDNDGDIDAAYVIYLVAYINTTGPPPPVQANADPNGDCCVDKADIAYRTAYLAGTGPAPVACTCVNPPLCDCRVGDANGDSKLNVGDAVYIISYVFRGGPLPTPYGLCSGDVNCDCKVNVGDAVYMISYIFRGGPAPCGCCTWLNICGAPLRE